VPKVQALCMSPTRELAIQSTRVLQQLAQFTGLQIVSVIGGVRYTQPVNAHIVIGTPGKLCDVIKFRLLDLSALKVR
jgi:superfamily II DNA/RNA helicase